MAQFFVYENTNRATKKTYPYLLDIQSNLLADLRTTVVIPPSPVAIAGSAAIAKLCPVLKINRQACVALTQHSPAWTAAPLAKRCAIFPTTARKSSWPWISWSRGYRVTDQRLRFK